MVLLSVESENGSVLTYRLAKTQIVVGSSSKSDIVVRSPGVSERHLVIHRNEKLFTFVTVDRQTVVLNGERRARGVLNPGDRLRLGVMTLVFRGSEDDEAEPADEQQASTSGPARTAEPTAPVAREESEVLSFKADPAGFAEARSRLVQLFLQPRSDRLQQLVAILREALPEAEVAILAPGEGERSVALASVWTGDLPRITRRILSELAVPGRYVLLGSNAGTVAAVAAVAGDREVAALVVARPAGALGDEGVSLLGEAARFLAVQWREVGTGDTVFAGWEAEARRRLEALLPGSSQAVQALRTGVLSAAHGAEPVLICGKKGAGRTEVARILGTVGPVAGRPVVVFQGRGGELEALREELFGSLGRSPSGTAGPGGLVGGARGGLLIIRDVDELPAPLQSELASVIKSHRQEPPSVRSVRWVATCSEDPLALVQRGKLASILFMAFSNFLLRVPRLDERREDLPLVVGALLQRAASDQGKSVRGITLDCLNMILSHDFPGEMAELVGEVNRLVAATAEGEMVRCDELGSSVGPVSTVGGDTKEEMARILGSDNLKEIVPLIEQLLIDRVMKRVKGNQSKGARVLGISRGALIAKLREYNVPDYRYLRRRRSQ